MTSSPAEPTEPRTYHLELNERLPWKEDPFAMFLTFMAPLVVIILALLVVTAFK
jgi:hypothetical protein